MLGLVLLAIGGLPWLLWGVFLRVVVGLHLTWLVNSATHLWGSRRFRTSDDSRNLWWVALLTFGEGWHNNHHAYPRMANHRHKWWEFDPTFLAIRLMQWTGLAWDIVDYKRASDRQSD
jgi:stearoyl-CoA desaturase (delta-9 desaturase)